MEITFETIVSYLSNKKDSFINNINIVKPIDTFNFDIPMFRIGILNKNEETNISLTQSILNLINTEYIYKNKEEKLLLGKYFINELRNYWKLNYKDINNNFNSIRGEKAILNLTKNTNESLDILYVLSFCLHTNVLVLDYQNTTSKIISYYMNESNLNFYKPFIILAKNNNNYEPVFNHEKKIFAYDDIVNYLTSYNSIEIEDIFQTKSVFISKNNSYYSVEKLTKMLKKDLQEICDIQEIKYKKKDLKKTLIEKITNR
tara:strand:- start:515 stop:1291 length:777 start_codon:yes stop_codon:yes gene_type:complete